jgi:hypothetical protein
MEHFNTGLPCMHEFLIGLKRHKRLLFSERWFKNYEKETGANKHLALKVIEKNYSERTYVYRELLNNS